MATALLFLIGTILTLGLLLAVVGVVGDWLAPPFEDGSEIHEGGPAMNDHQLDYALSNLEGCLGKLEDAQANRYGQTWERAGSDSVEPLRYYLTALRAFQAELRTRGFFDEVSV